MGWFSKKKDDTLNDIPKELRDALARLKGRKPSESGKMVKTPGVELFPISKEIAEEERLQEAARQPDQMIAGQGVFLGKWQPKDRDGKSLGKIFNVFAAPQDLPDTMKYVDAVKHIAKLKGWNGFDGTNYATDKEIYKALKDGSYNGGWIIPTRDILVGTDIDGNKTQANNLFAHQNKGAFKGTFETAAAGDGSGFPDWYWSSTEYLGNPSHVWSVRFSDGNGDWDRKDDDRLSCRPVRLVEVAAP
jgi:hypothetical protein